jgi:hypothetical protein
VASSRSCTMSQVNASPPISMHLNPTGLGYICIIVAIITRRGFVDAQAIPFQPATRFDYTGHSCLNGGCECAMIGYPAFCCARGSQCVDNNGSIGCCPTGKTCQPRLDIEGPGCSSDGAQPAKAQPPTQSGNPASRSMVVSTLNGAVATISLDNGDTNIYLDTKLTNPNANVNRASHQCPCCLPWQFGAGMMVFMLWTWS